MSTMDIDAGIVTNNPKFGIITALPREFAAVKSMLDGPRRVDPPSGDHNIYEIGAIPSLSGNCTHLAAVTLQTQPGNNIAAATITNLRRSFPSVEHVLMVGIAGGVPNHRDPGKHVRLGDIVVSSHYGIVQYDNISLTSKGVQLRGVSQPPSQALLAVVSYLEAGRLAGSYPWEAHMKRAADIPGVDRPEIFKDVLHRSRSPYRKQQHPTDVARKPGFPKLYYGRIASSNILLKDPLVRDLLRDELDIRAVEMESSGISDGAAGTGYLVVRGVVDYCDSFKNDDWQIYASVVAAAYMRSVIETVSC
ncbi:hypothetical protein ACIF6L_23680 [Kitasatospora sp. NPDC086009]|uniref:5'-methylthioadenosine/S-adenosylhomocysteine nucleosidase family protein n=1 Tax=unclassified Kitasatospora TaxID=2633591 RepID=UPI0037C962DE